MDKMCKKCGTSKSIDMFSKDKSKKDGLCSTCKECSSRNNKEWRAKNTERVKQYFSDKYYRAPDVVIDRVRQWRKNNPEKKNNQNKKWVAEHPVEYQAHNILNAAIRDGKITKPLHCSGCNNVSDLQAHHKDYTSPLNVMWLCAKCHAREHRVRR